MAAAETAKLIAQLILDDKQFQAALNRSTKGVDRLDKGFGRSAKGAGQLGKGLLRVGAIAGGAVALGIGAAGKAAIDFESAFAGVRKTVSGDELAAAGLSFEGLKKQFIDLSTRIPITASELARLGEAAGALGVKASDITKFSEVTAKLGVTTNLTADEAADSLGKIGTILGLTGKQYENFGDILVNLGNKGASTEVEIIEITKRFAAAGKSAGLSTAQILGFASAISSAGVEPEAAGGALSRLFGKIVQETALATDKGKAFAKVSGKAFKDFSKIVEKDTAGAMLTFIKSLSKLSKFDQAKALKSVGITNTRDINAIRLLAQTYEKNLIPALKNAEDSAGALDKEAGVRFDTIKSKFALLKNALIKGGIEIGDGFLPALGRLTTKVTAFVNTNSGKLQKIGVDIGKALDDIDWKEVERGANKVADAAQVILDVVKQIPTEVKIGGLAFIGLDKASGGLLGKGLGNIAGGAVGGIGGALADRFFARGSSPANPVFVSGGGGGPGGGNGVPGGGGVVAALGGAGFLAGIAAALGVASTANAAQGQIKVDAFGAKNGPRESKDLAVIIALTREQNGTLRIVDRDVLEAYRGIKSEQVKAVEAANATTTKVESTRALFGQKSDASRQATIAAGFASKNATDRVAAASRATTRAIDRKDLSVTVKTTTIIRPSIREQANAVTSRTTHKIL